MAEQNWYSNGNVDWNATNAWNTQADGLGTALTDPDTDAHVIIQGSDTITITAAIGNTIKSLTIDSGSDLDGHASHIIETTAEGDASFGSNGYAVKINGTTDSNVNITVGGTFSTLVDLDGTMGNLILKGAGSKQFRGTPTIGGNVTIQDSCPVDCAGAVQINGNFTITSGSYDTGSDHALTVTGNVLNYGTLTLNGSAFSAAFFRNYSTGVVPASTGQHTFTDALRNDNSYTFTNGNTLLTGRGVGNSGYVLDDQGSTMNYNGGTINIGNGTDIGANTNIRPQASHDLNDLIINCTNSRIVYLATACDIAGDLTITAGALDTNSSSNYALTVTGKTTIGDASHGSEDQATLTCNASAISLGSGKTDDYAVQMLAGGTFAGGNANHTIGSIRQNAANTKFTFTSATTTINSEYTSADRMFEMIAGKAYNADGRITLSGNFTSGIQWNGTSGDTGPHTLRINDASLTVKPRTALIVEENLNIDAGTFNTSHSYSANNALTVTGAIDITGTLTGNASAISAGGLRVNSGGLYTATSGVTSITGELSSHAFRISGGGTLANSNGTVTFLNVNSRLTMNGTGNLHNLILNHASCVIMLQSDGTTTVEGDLTITAGTLTTEPEGGGTSKNLTVTGDVSVTGTLTGNASAISMGSLTIADAGTYNGTTGTTTILNEAGGYAWNNLETDGTGFVHNNGTVHFDFETGGGTNDTKAKELTWGHVKWTGDEPSHELTFEPQTGSTVTIAKDLTIHEGYCRPTSLSLGSWVVTEDVLIESGGTIGHVNHTGAMTFGSLTISSGGTYIATSGTTTITSKTSDNYGIKGGGTFTHNNGEVKVTGNAYRFPVGATYYDFTWDTSSEPCYLYSTALSGGATIDGTQNAQYTSILGTLKINDRGFVPYNSHKVFVNNLIIGDNTDSANATNFDFSDNDVFDGDVIVNNILINADGQLKFGDNHAGNSDALEVRGAFRNLGGASGVVVV